MYNANCEDKNGWIYIHLSGTLADIYYQHGYLVAKEIDTLIKVMQFYLPKTAKKYWNFTMPPAGFYGKIQTKNIRKKLKAYRQRVLSMIRWILLL